MSNSIKNESSNKEKHLKLLGSKIFPDILEASILEPLTFNKLMVAHIAAIVSQCHGIKEGTCYIEYVTSSEQSFTKDVIGPKLCFSLFNNSYGLLEHTNRSTRSSRRITNLNDFSYSDFHNARMLKDFILKQELRMKHLLGYDWESLKEHNIKVEYKKPPKAECVNYFYETIIEANKEVESFLNHYFLKSDLTNESIGKTKKMKL